MELKLSGVVYSVLDEDGEKSNIENLSITLLYVEAESLWIIDEYTCYSSYNSDLPSANAESSYIITEY